MSARNSNLAGFRPRSLTKPEHREMIFNTLKKGVTLAVQYTVLWTGQHEPSETGFLEWLEDVVKMLPTREADFPMCTSMMYDKIVKRTQDNPTQLVEDVDLSLPLPEPATIKCSDGASAVMEQAPCNGLTTPNPCQPYSIKSNTPGFLPVSHITSTPVTSTDAEVQNDGSTKNSKVPPAFEPKAGPPGDKVVQEGSGDHEETAAKPNPPIQVPPSLPQITQHPNDAGKPITAPPQATPRPSVPSASTGSGAGPSSSVPPARLLSAYTPISKEGRILRRPPKQMKDASTQIGLGISSISFPKAPHKTPASSKHTGTFLDPNDHVPVNRSLRKGQPSFRWLRPSSSASGSRPIKPLPPSRKQSDLGNGNLSSVIVSKFSGLRPRVFARSASFSMSRDKGKKRAREPEDDPEGDGEEGPRPAQRSRLPEPEVEPEPLFSMSGEEFEIWKKGMVEAVGSLVQSDREAKGQERGRRNHRR